MDPASFDELFLKRPISPMILTLSSGDQITITQDDAPYIEGLSLVLRGRESPRFHSGPRLISLPNIAMIQPVDRRFDRGSRRT